MNDRLETRMQELRTLAKEHSKAEAKRVYLEEFKKSKLAILMKDAEKKGVTSNAAQERDARANPEYLAFLDGLLVATEEAESKEWELKIALEGARLWQTDQANKRAERKGYGA